MEKSSLTALLVVIVFIAVGAPAYVGAAGCCPGSGCCGTGQTYVGQQLFPNPAAPGQVSFGPAGTPPRQITNVTEVVSSTRKAAATQTKTVPMLRLAPQTTGEPLEVLTFSCSPCLGTLW